MLDPSFISSADVRAMIRNKARSMLGRAGLRHQDQPDLEQDLSLSLLKGLHHFDPGRGSHRQFAGKVLAHARASILRDRSAKKLGAAGLVSSGCGSVPDTDRCKRAGRSMPSHEEHSNLKLDVAATLSKLPVEANTIAELLKQYPTAETARRLGMPRTTLISQLGPEGVFHEFHRAFT